MSMMLHRRSSPGARARASIIVFCCAVFVVVSRSFAELLSLSDLEALTQIRSNLQDLPGSSFFSSWDFSKDPCNSFDGVQCFSVDGELRVVSLNLGTSSGSSPGLQGSLSYSIGQLTALAQLTLVPGSVGGEVPSSIGSLSNLQFLGLSENHFSGKIPSSISNLYKLQSFIINGNHLYGNIPASLGYLPSLSTLSLSNNQLSGRVPDFSSARSLQHLDCSTNELSGGIPALPSNLLYLSLGDNQLSGGMSAVSRLTSLNYLDLSSNQLDGQIPHQVFSFPLQYLLLDRNQLSGRLIVPSASTIQVVDLSYNNLTGTIPAALAGVTDLYLNDNRFAGMVPPIFSSNLRNSVIETLNLQHNYLIGLSNLLVGMTFPPQVILCFQYNCGLPPPQSLCPSNAGVQETRPLNECLDAGNWGSR